MLGHARVGHAARQQLLPGLHRRVEELLLRAELVALRAEVVHDLACLGFKNTNRGRGILLSNQPAYLFSIKFAKCLSSFLERLLKLLQCCCNFDEKQSVSETLKKSGNVTEHLRNCTKNCKCHVWSGAKTKSVQTL